MLASPKSWSGSFSSVWRKRPAHRYPDAAELKAELLATQSEGLRPQGPPSSPPLPRGTIRTPRNPAQPQQRSSVACRYSAGQSLPISEPGGKWIPWCFDGATVVAGMVWWFREDRKQPVRPPEVKRLTFDSGLALHPAVSPDGKYLAFASDRAGERNLDIWVQALPEENPYVSPRMQPKKISLPSHRTATRSHSRRNATAGEYTPSRFWEESPDCWPKKRTSRDTRPMGNSSRLRFLI